MYDIHTIYEKSKKLIRVRSGTIAYPRRLVIHVLESQPVNDTIFLLKKLKRKNRSNMVASEYAVFVI